MADYRPQVPAIDLASEVMTFADACQQVRDTFDLENVSSARERRNVRRSVLEAYRDMPSQHEWSYYQRRGQVTTVAAYSTGTIAYDHTGGANERQVTLSDGTWPDSARFYRLKIEEVWYKVEDRKSSTVLTLTQDSNPGADVAAGTSYTLARSSYPLPVNFRRMAGEVLDLSGHHWIQFKSPEEWLRRQFGHYGPTTPLAYTFRNGGEFYAGMSIEFGPAPDEAVTWDFVYEAFPQRLKPYGTGEEYTSGTVSVSGTTVTGTGTAWTDSMVGAVIRFSSGGAVPTGAIGEYPYSEQRIVQSVTSGTSLTIDSALNESYSGVKHSIGDPLDCDPTMLTYVLRLAEEKYARLARHEELKDFVAMSRAALVEAKIADNRQRDSGSSPLYWSWLDIGRSTDDV